MKSTTYGHKIWDYTVVKRYHYWSKVLNTYYFGRILNIRVLMHLLLLLHCADMVFYSHTNKKNVQKIICLRFPEPVFLCIRTKPFTECSSSCHTGFHFRCFVVRDNRDARITDGRVLWTLGDGIRPYRRWVICFVLLLLLLWLACLCLFVVRVDVYFIKLLWKQAPPYIGL